MHKFPLSPIFANILKVCSVLVFAFLIFIGVTSIRSTSSKIKEERAQLKQAETMMASNPMIAQQYGPQIQQIKDDLKPASIAMAYTQAGFFFIIAIVLLAFLWGTADLFLAAREIEYNSRKTDAITEAEPVPAKAAAAE